ncbi:MAG: domain containing protein [Chloroflexi bacterium]|nr:domain containing protein [Chloroflexota bacterium]
MIVCPHCKTEQMNGTMFCSECGWELQTTAPKSREFDLDELFSTQVPAIPVIPPPNPVTRRSSTNSKKNTPDVKFNNSNMPNPPPPSFLSNAAFPGLGGISWQTDINFMVLNTGRMVKCPQKERLIIGRSDPTQGDTPDIDLNQDKGAELGVSRRHASLSFQDEQVFLTDLGSTNRTFINRKPLMRGQPYEIHNGDEIRLGNIILKVIFNRELSLG